MNKAIHAQALADVEREIALLESRLARLRVVAGYFREMATEPDSPGELAMKLAMKEFSRRGGSKGGKRRAELLSPQRLSEIARTAARARWGNGWSYQPAIDPVGESEAIMVKKQQEHEESVAICEHCGKEIREDEVQQCPYCGMDGLGNCCIADIDHECDEAR